MRERGGVPRSCLSDTLLQALRARSELPLLDVRESWNHSCKIEKLVTPHWIDDDHADSTDHAVPEKNIHASMGGKLNAVKITPCDRLTVELSTISW